MTNKKMGLREKIKPKQIQHIEKKLGRKLTKSEIKEADEIERKFTKAFNESDTKLQALKKLGFVIKPLDDFNVAPSGQEEVKHG